MVFVLWRGVFAAGMARRLYPRADAAVLLLRGKEVLHAPERLVEYVGYPVARLWDAKLPVREVARLEQVV